MCAQAELSLSGPSSFDGTSLGLHGLRPSVCMTEGAAVPKALLKSVSHFARMPFQAGCFLASTSPCVSRLRSQNLRQRIGS